MTLQSRQSSLILAGAAAFATYFCMYAFRKPFTAGMYEGQEWFSLQLKTALILSQLLGYTLSKFLGVKFVSEIQPHRRAIAIVGLIGISQVALIVFAFAPPWLQIVAMFINGLPLGMIFGLVLSYLEGRRQTEALSAALCASFIVASGVVKSLGRTLIDDFGVSEFAMPMCVGFLFAIPTLFAVWLLNRTPRPDEEDIQSRAIRTPMTRAERMAFWNKFWPGLSLFLFVYILLTIVRTVRDDFGVEIWRDLGMTETPSVFAWSETWVAIITTCFAGLLICIRNHLMAIRVTGAAVCLAFGLSIAVTLAQMAHWFSPLAFMVVSGILLYVPYVAFHTTLFERLVASSRLPSNLGFLMYLADSLGYLGYAAIIVFKTTQGHSLVILPIFRGLLISSGILCAIATAVAVVYFQRRLSPVEANHQEDLGTCEVAYDR